MNQTSEGYAYLESSGMLSDTYHLAEKRDATSGTTNGFDLNSKSDSRIDHIFVNAPIKVLRYTILTDTYHSTLQGTTTSSVTRLPSDHYPVLVELEFK